MTTEETTTTTRLVAGNLRKQSVGYQAGWWFLMLMAAISFVGHLLAPFAFAPANEAIMFWALAAMSLYAMAVLLVPYRRAERWAWWVTWVHVAIYAVVIVGAPQVGPIYLTLAVLMAVAQLATSSAFRDPNR